jgi:hypothetical protein
MNDEVVHQLIREVAGLLDAGVVGLYEFVDQIRDDHPEMTSIELQAHAEAALRQLRADGHRLVWAAWARPGDTRDASEVVPSPRDWSSLQQDPYLAIAPSWLPPSSYEGRL